MKSKTEIPDKLDRAELENICKRQGILALYLFGSHVEGIADDLSDIDLGVVFPKGTDLSDTIQIYIDLFGAFADLFSTEQVDIVFLQQAGPILADKAIRGKLLYSADENARLDFEDYILMRALDFRPWIRQYDREMLKAIREGGNVGRG